MGAPRIIKSNEHLKTLWSEFKIYCDNQNVLTHDFSSKNSEFVSKELKRSITYTIEGFCVFAGISRQAFYKNYANNKRYIDTVMRINEECEVDARKKFELQIIPSQLAGLWMSNYGYSTQAKNNIDYSAKEKDALSIALEKLAGELNADK